jgi:hypothetical protein
MKSAKSAKAAKFYFWPPSIFLKIGRAIAMAPRGGSWIEATEIAEIAKFLRDSLVGFCRETRFLAT